MAYEVADAWDNEAGLTPLTPQPKSPGGVQFANKTYAASGRADWDGEPFIDLVYTILEHAEYNTIRTQLGLSDTIASNDVTIRIRKNDDTFGNYNGTVEQREGERNPLGWRVTFRVKLVEAL